MDFTGGSSLGVIHSEDYLSIWQGNQQVYYHAGLLEDTLDSDNKFALVINMLTDNSKDRICNLYINNNNTLPTNFVNWRVKNVEGGFDTTFSSSTHLQFSDNLKAGEGKLYNVAPVVKFGGSLLYSETISGTNSLLNDMTINNGIELIVEDEYIITDTITLDGSGFITGDGYVYLSGNGKININRWDKGLFKSKSDNHPQLIWDEYPSTLITVTGYKIFRKYGAAAWEVLTTVSDTIHSYIDETVNINPPGGQAGTNIYYKVTATYGVSSETIATNTITVNVVGNQIEKKDNTENINKLEYSLEQNYPNPFNPSTTISYTLPFQSSVKLIIYDIMGSEVKAFNVSSQSAGHQSVVWDGKNELGNSVASGIYLYRISIKSLESNETFVKTAKLMLMK